jgi:hypothetical protein
VPGAAKPGIQLTLSAAALADDGAATAPAAHVTAIHDRSDHTLS